MKIKLFFLILTSCTLLITSANAESKNVIDNGKNQKKKAAALKCDSRITLGFGDTTKPSDTRFAAQWCRARMSLTFINFNPIRFSNYTS